MIKKKAFTIMLILIFLLPIFKLNAENATAGFISGNIWYSQDPFKEGDNIKIHTIVYNTDKRELTGTIFFFDGTLFLGNRSLSVPPKSSVDVAIDWKVTAGNHSIFAQIQNAKFLLTNGEYENASLLEIKSEESKRNVEKILPETKEVAKSNNVSDSSIVNMVKDNTPAIVSKTINTTTNLLENIRDNVNIKSTENKTKVKAELQKINKTTNNTDKKDINKISPSKKDAVVEKTNTKQNIFLKPFIYAKLFFFSLFAFITGSKIVFYGLVILIVFSILRFIWRLIF